ncbi:hypothetical protein OIDMADRAFT_140491 [Oidiodendron maius Zn]|uniref:Uncharacterized protein n=1 Tax=Oidiodendron maius (strain Zn) TaxID=913774 RepID=A0A0C3D9J6_OIDMZ|nr:hypothetical protein OIDMADRAFT_140491 [Oidiodendron maius Zn]
MVDGDCGGGNSRGGDVGGRPGIVLSVPKRRVCLLDPGKVEQLPCRGSGAAATRTSDGDLDAPIKNPQIFPVLRLPQAPSPLLLLSAFRALQRKAKLPSETPDQPDDVGVISQAHAVISVASGGFCAPRPVRFILRDSPQLLEEASSPSPLPPRIRYYVHARRRRRDGRACWRKVGRRIVQDSPVPWVRRGYAPLQVGRILCFPYQTLLNSMISAPPNTRPAPSDHTGPLAMAERWHRAAS